MGGEGRVRCLWLTEMLTEGEGNGGGGAGSRTGVSGCLLRGGRRGRGRVRVGRNSRISRHVRTGRGGEAAMLGLVVWCGGYSGPAAG